MVARGSRVLGSGHVRPPCGCEGGTSGALSICLRNPGEAGSKEPWGSGLGVHPHTNTLEIPLGPLSREAFSVLSSGE